MIFQMSKEAYDFCCASIEGYRLEYSSSIDDVADWAIVCPGKNKTWIVNIHGHDAQGDQLFTHKPIESWLDLFLTTGCGILCPHIRGNSWMSPSAVTDTHDLLEWLRLEYGAQKFIFFGASMGATSNLIYSVIHPQDVTACIALGAATDLSSYYQWCRQRLAGSIPQQIADAIEDSYGSTPKDNPEIFKKHSTLGNLEKLTMPVLFAHGQCDDFMPVSHARQLARKMSGRKNFEYHEVPSGDHGSPAESVQCREFLLENCKI